MVTRRYFLPLIAIFVLSACAPTVPITLEPTAEATEVASMPEPIRTEEITEPANTPTSTPTSDPGLIPHSPSATASATPTPGDAIPTTEPDATHIDPLVLSKLGLLSVSWSPDSQWITYLNLQDTNAYVRNAETGEECLLDAIPQSIEWCYWCGGMGASHLFAWQADGRIFLIDVETAASLLVTPCGEVTDVTIKFPSRIVQIDSVSPDARLFILHTAEGAYLIYDSQTQRVTRLTIDYGDRPVHIAWSPRGTHIAFSAGRATGAITWAVNTQTGQASEQIRWNSASTPNPCCTPPKWLDETHFYVEDTDRGPLLVTLDQGEEALIPSLFGTDLCADHSCDYAPAVQAHSDATSGDYHVLLYQGSGRLPFLLYHSESGEVETLPEGYYYSFRADWLEAVDRDGTQRRFRPPDPSGAELQKLRIPFDTMLLSITPAHDHYAVSPGGSILTIYTLHGDQVGAWWSDDVTTWSVYWSPDQQHMALIGDAGFSIGVGLYMLPVP
jgi:WD40 repeat protein